MKIADQIIQRSTEVENAVKNAPDEFIERIVSDNKGWDFDFILAAVRELEKRQK